MTDLKALIDHALLRVPDATKIYVNLKGIGETLIERPSAASAGSSALPESPAIAAAPAASQASVPPAAKSGANFIEAEFDGIFYSSATPDAPPFVSVGQTIKKGDVICVIEIMKTMNEIESPISGKITAVLAENGSMIKRGHPLYEVVS